eukprot:tig00001292_g8052.t1
MSLRLIDAAAFGLRFCWPVAALCLASLAVLSLIYKLVERPNPINRRAINKRRANGAQTEPVVRGHGSALPQESVLGQKHTSSSGKQSAVRDGATVLAGSASGGSAIASVQPDDEAQQTDSDDANSASVSQRSLSDGAPPPPPRIVPRPGPVSAAEREQAASVRAFWQHASARERKAITSVKAARVLECLRSHYGASRSCMELLQRALDAISKNGGIVGAVRGASTWAGSLADAAVVPALSVEEPVEPSVGSTAPSPSDVLLVSSRKDLSLSVAPELLSASGGERLIALLARRVTRIASGHRDAGQQAVLPERSLARAASAPEEARAASDADEAARRAVEALGAQEVVLSVCWRLILDRLVGAYVGYQRRLQAGPSSCPGSPPAGGLQSAASAPAAMGRGAVAGGSGSGEEDEGPEEEHLSARSSSRASSPPRPAAPQPPRPAPAPATASAPPHSSKPRGGVVTLLAATEAAKDGAVLRRAPGDGSSRSARKRKNKKSAGGAIGRLGEEPATAACLASNASHSDSGVSRDASPRPAWAVAPPEVLPAPAPAPLLPLAPRPQLGLVQPPVTGAVDTTSPQYRAIFAQYYRAYMAAAAPPLPTAPISPPSPPSPVLAAGSPLGAASQSMFSSDPLRLVATRRGAAGAGPATPSPAAVGPAYQHFGPPSPGTPQRRDRRPRPSPRSPSTRRSTPAGTSSPTVAFWAGVAADGPAAGPAAPSPSLRAVSGHGSVAFPDPTCPAIWEPLGKGALGLGSLGPKARFPTAGAPGGPAAVPSAVRLSTGSVASAEGEPVPLTHL